MTKGYLVSEGILRELREWVTKARNAVQEVRAVQQRSVSRAPRMVEFRNDSGETVPRRGVLRVTGNEVVGNRPTYKATKPDTTFARLYLVNGDHEVRDGDTGYATWLHEADYASYNSGSGTPAYGEVWGPKSGQWTLEKYYYGFLIQGHTTQVGDVDVVLATQHLVTSVQVKTNGAHARGDSQAVHLYDTNDTDTTIDIASVLNRYADLEDDVWADLVWQGDKPVLVAGDCVGE